MFRKIFCLFSALVLFIQFFAVICNSSVSFQGDDRITVVIDPGHGGKDGGAQGTYSEAYYNLEVAKAFANELERNGSFNVKMTRTTPDEYLTLAERGVFADSVNADLIVSIHFNSSDSPSAKGVEVYTSVLPEYDMADLGESICSRLSSAVGLSSRGCFQKFDNGSTVYYWSDKYQWDIPGDSSVGGASDYYGIITWAAKFGFPGIIIEHAYLSNGHDLEIANSKENLAKMGKADAEAVIDYYTNHAHSYESEYTDDYPVSCFSCGKKSVHCSICGHRKNVTGISSSPDPNAHLWLPDGTTPASCFSDGSTDYYCRYTHNLIDKGCTQFEEHTKHEVIPRLEHSYTITYSQELTHTQDGITTYTCTRCGDSYSETEKAEGHTFEEIGVREVSCTSGGGTEYKCTVCGEVFFDELTPALGHDYEVISHTDGDCETDETDELKCRVCGAEDTVVKKAAGHDFTEISFEEADCTRDGERILVCSICKKEKTEAVASTGHKFIEASHSNPTCDTDGETVFKCEVCGESKTEAVAPTGHDWGEPTVERSPALFTGGTAKSVCLNDPEHIKTEVLPSKFTEFTKAHTPLTVIVAAVITVLIVLAVLYFTVFRKKLRFVFADGKFKIMGKFSVTDIAEGNEAEALSEENEAQIKEKTDVIPSVGDDSEVDLSEEDSGADEVSVSSAEKE